MNKYHISVLLQEIIELLNVRPGAKYIDATLGGGGHSFEILKHGGKVLGIDADQDALDYVEDAIKRQKSKNNIDEAIVLVKGNFRDIKKKAQENGFEHVSGIIFDLGISSHQVDIAERGFSFRKNGILDMRMDRDLNVKARDLVNILTKGELYELFNKLGEERYAYAVANNIVKSRRIKPIETTADLTEIVSRVVRNSRIEGDTLARIYQALRIAVNDELNSLKTALPQAFELLADGGRIAVISFHSLEDRIVKRQFLEWEERGKGEIITKKPIVPKERELEDNSRSRSAKLRVFRRKKL